MKKLIMAAISIGLVSVFMTGCSTSPKSANAETEVKDPDTITIAWLPNQGGDDFKDARTEVDNIIAKATGLKVADKLTTDYAITIEAVASGQAQIAYVGAQQYIEAHDKNSKVLPLVVNSGNSGTLSDALYYSRFCVKKGNEDQYKSGSDYSIDNIAGKKIAFVSNSSTSGFKVPTSTIVSYFSKKDKYKDLKQDDMLEGGKFFSQVLFAGSHQLSAVNLLNGKVDVAAFDDTDLASYVNLSSGAENKPGAVYTVKSDAVDPFKVLAGQQYVVIKAMPVMNGPLMVNTGTLSKKTIDTIKKTLMSDDVTNNTKIFIPKDAKYKGMYNQPQKFISVEDKWYDPIRDLSK
ncbi:MAG: phosphate/phosphite/phosphonate ABC transporter substrate-binding protein [Bacillota bacterium]|nr:phosphate/phosphite/phosphonate ABC transporter substrate-binding protein [Bacillota bacterium]